VSAYARFPFTELFGIPILPKPKVLCNEIFIFDDARQSYLFWLIASFFSFINRLN
jgi:hypothetical protein